MILFFLDSWWGSSSRVTSCLRWCWWASWWGQPTVGSTAWSSWAPFPWALSASPSQPATSRYRTHTGTLETSGSGKLSWNPSPSSRYTHWDEVRWSTLGLVSDLRFLPSRHCLPRLYSQPPPGIVHTGTMFRGSTLGRLPRRHCLLCLLQ